MAKKIEGKSDYWYYLYGIFCAGGKNRKEAEKLADWYSSDEYNNRAVEEEKSISDIISNDNPFDVFNDKDN